MVRLCMVFKENMGKSSDRVGKYQLLIFTQGTEMFAFILIYQQSRNGFKSLYNFEHSFCGRPDFAGSKSFF